MIRVKLRINGNVAIVIAERVDIRDSSQGVDRCFVWDCCLLQGAPAPDWAGISLLRCWTRHARKVIVVVGGMYEGTCVSRSGQTGGGGEVIQETKGWNR